MSKVFSAPGKASLAGGYLVLFPEFSAFSVALSSRMYAVVSKSTSDENGLIIESPQFVSEWKYPSMKGTHPNPFLNACYDVVVKYFGKEISGKITIYSDDGFHSQQKASPNHFHNRFNHHHVPITEVSKTGLGSSAASVVAVVAALVYLGDENLAEDLNKIHNLAQIAHSNAQGKIGSGFDVATAVFGTILYSRFDPNQVMLTDNSREELIKIVNKPWKFTAKHCVFPDRYGILMGDVAQGSETPGMVKQVLQWHSDHPDEAGLLFQSLNKSNMDLFNSMNSGEESDPQSIRSAILEIRNNLQELTRKTGVPIEPPRQTELLNRATEVNGVLGGVVPGAGGDDAVCLVLDTSAVARSEILHDLEQIKGVMWMDTLSLDSEGLKIEHSL